MSKKISDKLGADESYAVLGNQQDSANEFVRRLVSDSKPVPGTRADELLRGIVAGPNKTSLGAGKVAGRQAGSVVHGRNPRSRKA